LALDKGSFTEKKNHAERFAWRIMATSTGLVCGKRWVSHCDDNKPE
jgi:hypothetical protein